MCATATSAAVKLKNIMVATDLSNASIWSLPLVTAIAGQYQSTIKLAHVIPIQAFQAARLESFDAIEMECRDYARAELERLSARLRVQGAVVETLIGEGDVARVICHWVNTQKIDLLAVGTSGRSGISKFAAGSIAEELIRTAPCPVLTFGPAISSEWPAHLRRVLHATDLSASSVNAGLFAWSLAHHYDSRLVVLCVTSEHLTQISRRALIRQLRYNFPTDSDLATPPEELIAQGKPAGKILEVADEHSVDLIVMGSGGTARPSSHFGSTVHDVVVGASCPVLLVGDLQHH